MARGEPVHPAFSIASPNFDATYYHLALSVNMVAGSISGTVQVEGDVTGSPLSVLTLDLASSMVVSAVTLLDNTPLGFAHPGAALNITLPAPVAPGGSVGVKVTYSGTPVVGGFGNFVFGTLGGKRFAWSLSEPYGAREWWPCKDHPSDKADAVRVTITVPSIYRVGSQGTLTETVDDPNTIYDWVSNYPTSSYLVSVSIGEYVRYQNTYTRTPARAAQWGPLSMPLEDLVYNDGSSSRPSGWANVTDVLDVFEDWFGPYPFATEKYGHAECTFGGGMEHQTMSSMGGSSVGLVAHELGHQWYGDGISPKSWPHLWLNEGFATYSEIIYFQERAATYPGTATGLLFTRYNTALGATGTLVVQDTTSIANMFNNARVYAKGACVLNMLRFVVGDADFKSILRAYTADDAVQYGNATTADFKRVAEAESGMDLDQFFSQWVTEGTGYPFYSSYYSTQPQGGAYKVWVNVTQFQTPPYSNVDVFEMPMVIAVQTTGGEERFTVQNNQREQLFELTVLNPPTGVTLDPDNVILRSDIITSVPGITPSLLTITSLSPNPSQNSFSFNYEVGNDGPLDYELFDVAGRRVLARAGKTVTAGTGMERVDTSSLAAGIYFLRVRAGHQQVTRKLVVVR